MSQKQSIWCDILLYLYYPGVGLQIASLQVNMRLKVVGEHVDRSLCLENLPLCCMRRKDYCHIKRVNS